MSGIFTNTRYSVGNSLGPALYYEVINRSDNSLQRLVAVKKHADCLNPVPSRLVNDTYNVTPGSYNWISGLLQDSVTSFRSGPLWDSTTPDQKGDSSNSDLFPLMKGKLPDSGHVFNSSQYRVISNDTQRFVDVVGIYAPIVVKYRGPIGVFGLDSSTNVLAPDGSSAVTNGRLVPMKVQDVNPVYGTKAIAKSLPTNPNVNVLTDLFEIRDGLPKFPGMALGATKSRAELLKKSGDEYLNYVFGIVPAISDIRAFLSSVSRASKVIKQLTKDSDKLVRRRFTFPLIQSTVSYTGTTDMTGFRPIPGVTTNMSFPREQMSGGTKSLVITDTKVDKIWFSGQFRYHLPRDDNAFGRIERTADLVDKLVGAKLTPDKVWQAIPWSWLVDWFVDVSDIMQNANFVNQYDGLLQYGYLMCGSTYTRVFTVKDVSFYDYSVSSGGVQLSSRRGPYDLSTTIVTTRKQRVRATPFGFGLNPSSFSDSQWAILGALGLSKGPKSLF